MLQNNKPNGGKLLVMVRICRGESDKLFFTNFCFNKKTFKAFLHFSKLFAILISTIAQYIIAKWVIFPNLFVLLSKKT